MQTEQRKMYLNEAEKILNQWRVEHNSLSCIRCVDKGLFECHPANNTECVYLARGRKVILLTYCVDDGAKVHSSNMSAYTPFQHEETPLQILEKELDLLAV